MLSSPGYLGAFGYNESPERLGPPAGFWRFADDDAFHAAWRTAIDLNGVFGELGAPTYCHDVLALDQNRRALFQLLILSVRDDLYPRQFELMEQAVRWLQTQGHPDLDPTAIEIEGTSRAGHADSMRKLTEYSAQREREHTERRAKREQAERELAEHRRQQEAELAAWNARLDEEDRVWPYRKREILERLCRHFDLPLPEWVDLTGYWDEVNANSMEYTSEEWWERFTHPAEKQLYGETDRIFLPLIEQFDIEKIASFETLVDRFSLEPMEDLYRMFMKAAGKPFDLPWLDE